MSTSGATPEPRAGDARNELLRTKAEAIAQDKASKIPTVEVFASEFVNVKKTDGSKAASIEAIESILRIHILPFVAKKRLDQITDPVLTNLKGQWFKAGTSTSISFSERERRDRRRKQRRSTIV